MTNPYYLISIILFVASLLVSLLVNARFKKYSKYSTCLTGVQAAERILQANGIYNVRIQRIGGNLTDNYNPTSRVLSLSNSVYNSHSISAVAVAAHEVGHALQHAENYSLINIRKKLVPVLNFSSSLSYFTIMLGIYLSFSNLIMFGAILFSFIVLFNLITLPVEINASARALKQIRELNLLEYQEVAKGRKVLTAAGLTYFISLVSSLLTLFRYLSLANNHRKRN